MARQVQNIANNAAQFPGFILGHKHLQHKHAVFLVSTKKPSAVNNKWLKSVIITDFSLSF